MIVEQRYLINPSDASRTKPVIVTFAGSFILFGEKCDIRADIFNEAKERRRKCGLHAADVVENPGRPSHLQFNGDLKQTNKDMNAYARI